MTQTVKEQRLAAFASRTNGAKKYLEESDVTRAIWELQWLIRTLEDTQDAAPEQTYPPRR